MMVARMLMLCGDQKPPFILALAGRCLALRQVHYYGQLDVGELNSKKGG